MKRRVFLHFTVTGAASALAACGTEQGGFFESAAREPTGSNADLPGPATIPEATIVSDRAEGFISYQPDGSRFEIAPLERAVLERAGDGSVARRFKRPLDDYGQPVAVRAHEDRVVVLDRSNHRLEWFDRDGNHIRTLGKYGTDVGEFSYPRDLAFDETGLLYVADTLNHRIQILDERGKVVHSFGRLGLSLGDLNGPRSLAIDVDGQVHVGEVGSHRVQVLSPSGEALRTYGEHDYLTWSGPRALSPSAIVAGPHGGSCVADSTNGALEVYGPLGNAVTRFKLSYDDGAPAAPVHLSLAPNGDLFVAAIPRHG